MVELRCGGVAVVVDPGAGGRVGSLVVDGLELLVTRADEPGDAAMRWGCYPMAPWAGRVRRGRFSFAGRSHALAIDLAPHAIHGTTYTRPWDVEEASARRLRLRTDLGPGWPFAGWAVQVLTVHEDRLDLRLEVHAEREAMPASCGWHPWWRRRLARGGDVEIELAARWMYVRDGDGIPSGELVTPTGPPWDDCFTGLSSSPRLRWPGALSVTIDASCDHLVVFDEPPHAVCVEPQTAPPDALNLSALHLPTIVQPGQPLVATASLRFGGRA